MTNQARTAEDPRDAWDGMAGGFDDIVTPLTMALAEETLDRAGLRPGMSFLDVAAGSGALSIPAARRGARVLATDFAPAMVKRLQARARAEKLDGVEARVMDATALDLEDGTFDVVASQNGVSLLPDVQRGLREMARVAKPGGRVLLVAFADPRKAEFLGVPLGAIKQVVPGFQGPPMDPPPLPFQLADPEKMRRVLKAAGLRDVRVEPADWAIEHPSAAHALDLVANGHPIGKGVVASLTPAQRADVEAALDRTLRERASREGRAILHTEMNVGVGTT